jgi:undecaprenyl-diphosphatase
VIELLHRLDRSFFLFLNSFHADWLNSAMTFFSGQAIWVPFVGYFFWYSFKKFGKKETAYFALFLALAFIASDVTSSYILKNLVTRLRPCQDEELRSLLYSFGQRCGGKYGFVSSHAANSVTLVMFSMRTLRFQHKFAYLLWIIPALVGYSRIYLGVHYPGDIVGGAIVGASWALVFSSMFHSYQGAKRERLQEPLIFS